MKVEHRALAGKRRRLNAGTDSRLGSISSGNLLQGRLGQGAAGEEALPARRGVSDWATAPLTPCKWLVCALADLAASNPSAEHHQEEILGGRECISNTLRTIYTVVPTPVTTRKL